MTPASSPPISTSKKNCMLVRHPEVCVDHSLIASHFVGCSVCDLASVVEDHHPIGKIHHYTHVVLDQNDGRSHLVVDVEDEAAHVLLLLEVHSGHRLVEQQQLGLGGERAPELHPLLQAIGQPPDGRPAHV